MRRREPPRGSPTSRARPVLEPLVAGTRLWRIHPAPHHSPGELHQHTTAAGLTWTSNQDDDERAYLLWGDRLPPGALTHSHHTTAEATSLPLGFGDGLDWAMSVAASVRVEVI